MLEVSRLIPCNNSAKSLYLSIPLYIHVVLSICLFVSLSLCLSVCLCGRVAGYIDVVYYIYLSVHVTATRPRPLHGCLLYRSMVQIDIFHSLLNSTQLVLQCDCRVPTFNTDTQTQSWRRQKSVVSVVSCRFTNSITTTCCRLTSWQLLRLRGTYEETCSVDFGHYKRYNSPSRQLHVHISN